MPNPPEINRRHYGIAPEAGVLARSHPLGAELHRVHKSVDSSCMGSPNWPTIILSGLFAIIPAALAYEAAVKSSQATIEAAKASVQAEVVRGQNAVKLEDEQFQARLILKAVEAPSEADRVSTLQFFLRAGLIKDRDGRITALVARKDKVPIPYVPRTPAPRMDFSRAENSQYLPLL